MTITGTKVTRKNRVGVTVTEPPKKICQDKALIEATFYSNIPCNSFPGQERQLAKILVMLQKCTMQVNFEVKWTVFNFAFCN